MDEPAPGAVVDRRLRRSPVEPADAPWHGTHAGYHRHLCGCSACRRAWADYMGPRNLADRRAKNLIRDVGRAVVLLRENGYEVRAPDTGESS